MQSEILIDKLVYELKKFENETVNSRIEAFKSHGGYLNNIPEEYHPIMIELLSQAIYIYCIGIDSYYLYRNKKIDETTSQPAVRINQDINALQKARKIIHEKIFWKYSKYADIELPHIEEPTDKDRKAYNSEYQTTIELHSDGPRVDIIEDAKIKKKIYDTYCTLTDMINDLKKKEFEIFSRESYYPHKKPNKNEIRELLEIVKFQFNLKPSHNEAQLIAAI